MSKENKSLLLKQVFVYNIRAFLLWFKEYPNIFISTVLYSLFKVVEPLLGIYLLAKIISELDGNRDINVLKNLVIITILVLAGMELFKYILERCKKCAKSCIYYKEKKYYIRKLLSMDFCSVDDAKTHELLSVISQNRNWSGWGLYRILDNIEKLLSSVIKIVGSITLTYSLFILKVNDSATNLIFLNNPLFILLILVIIFVVAISSSMLDIKAENYWVNLASKTRLGNRLFGYFGFFGDNIDRSLDIRIYEQEKLCTEVIENDNFFTTKGEIAKCTRGARGVCKALSVSVSYVITFVVYIFVCLKALGGAYDIGKITQYIGGILALSEGITHLMNTLGDMKNNASFLKSNFEFLDIPNNMYQGELSVEKRQDNCYEVEFRDVSFKYPGSNNWALKNISMKFNVGRCLAVVGQNGSGKTTFIKLLCRLYDPTEGEILLNGINIRKYNYDEYMSIFSVVFQDYKLLAFTLGENIATSSDIDVEKAERCINGVGLDKKYSDLSDGLDTYLYKDFKDNGVELSGGEAQKVAIARAMYKNSSFMILDEPTAALDPISEYEIYSKLNSIIQDKTAVYISHRLSSCRFCDEIIVFNKGTIIQTGTHEELLEDVDNEYYKLWNAQAQYYA